MTIQKLQKLCDEQEAMGLQNLVLKMPTPKFRRHYPLRVRTPFGLSRWYPGNDDSIIIYPEIDKVRNYIRKVSK